MFTTLCHMLVGYLISFVYMYMRKLRFLNRGSRITDATQPPPPGLPPPPSQQNNIQSQYTFATDQQKFIRPIDPILNPDASHGSPGSFNSMPNSISENLLFFFLLGYATDV